MLEAMDRVLSHGQLLLGPEVEQLESRLAARCGVRHAVGVGSGSAALYYALRAADIGPGDEVITSAISFIATANAIVLAGAKPVFVDVDDDLNIDARAATAAVTPRTRAVVPVHYTGRVCDMGRLLDTAAGHDLLVIEDASQAFGATHEGRPVGSLGDAGAISLNPMKLLAACGEAGVVVTDRQPIRGRVEALRYNGLVNREDCLWPSTNGRIDTLQAAILLGRLERIDRVIERRREIALRYDAALAECVDVPGLRSGDVAYSYTIQTDRRDELRDWLEQAGIEVKVYHPKPMPDHAAYRLRGDWSIDNARRCVRRLLCLPVHEKLRDDEVDYVIDRVLAFFGGAR